MASVAERLQAYLEAQLAGSATEDQRKGLVAEADGLFETLKKARQGFDLEWYHNQRFMDGDHYLKFDVKTGKITNSGADDDAKGQRIKRTINLMKAQIRGLKNFVLKIPLTVEISPSPSDDTPEAEESARAEAKAKESVWRAVEDHLHLAELRRPLVDDGFLKHAGYFVVLPTPDGLVRVDWYDAYDVYPDSTAPSFQAGRVLFLATRQNVAEMKANKAYENTGELKGDGKLAASEFKANYEQEKLSGQKAASGDLEGVIWKQLFIKFPFTLQPVTQKVQKPVLDPSGQPTVDPDGQQVMEDVEEPVTGPDGQPQQRLVPYEDGKTRIWIVTFTSQDLHRIEETNFERWPAIRYVPEQTSNRVHGRAWAHDLKDPNKTVDNMVSKAEEWHLKASPKLLVPTDSKLKEITTTTAEVLEYNARTPEGLKDYMPSGVPESMFRLVNLAQGFLPDIGGMHAASGGAVPIGVKSGKGIEKLQAGDAEFNMAEPMENLGQFWKELVERIFDVIAENTTEQKTLEYDDEGMARKVTFIGEAGLKLKDGTAVEPPQGAVVVGKSRVRVRTVPEVSYSEDGKREVIKELYELKAIPLKTLLEAYRFGNVGEIVEEVMAEREREAKTPPPPAPVPADKLLNAIANVTKSGQPITVEQLNEAMAKAGLPPIQAAPDAAKVGLDAAAPAA